MYKGKEFGAAIARAIRLKLDSGGAASKAEIARHFGIKPPSLQDWEHKGTVAKDKLPELWRFFADVAGPEHWGISPEEWPAGLSADTAPHPVQRIDSDHMSDCMAAAEEWISAGRRHLDSKQRVELACHLYDWFFDQRPNDIAKMVKFLDMWLVASKQRMPGTGA